MRESAPAERHIGHYAILERLGEGGMGVVWKARDLRLNRLAAIKVLHAGRMNDEGRKRRFIQEAQSASALNHPNIVTIYEINRHCDADYIAMEYVQGRTLASLIPRGGMRLDDALPLAIQMAGALEAAHAAGIVHRDFKPGNVMVTDSGLGKLLDFGLAKLNEKRDTRETDTTRTVKAVTAEGTIAGTAAYMSPEQAEGRPVDHRSDLFSFGLVLYEMVTGQRAFQGETSMSTLAAVINTEPKPPGQIVPGLPREMERILARCLRKDPARRFQHASDLRIALQELKEESDSGQLAAPAPARTKRPHWLGAVAGLAIAAALGALWQMRGRLTSEPTARVVPLTSMPGSEFGPTFSPDGSQFAFSAAPEGSGNMDIYLRLVDGGATLRLTTAPEIEYHPSWSPDGRWIAFYRGSSLFLVSPLGGPERNLGEIHTGLGGDFNSPAWLPNGTAVIVSAPSGRLVRVSVAGGERREIPLENVADCYRGAAVSPDGRHLAFARSAARGADDLFVSRLDGSDVRRLTNDSLRIFGLAWTTDSRNIVFASQRKGGGLWKVALSGEAPQRIPGADSSARQPAISGSRLAFATVLVDENLWMGDLIRQGNGPPALHNIRRFPGSNRTDYSGAFSPDGSRIAFSSDRTGNFEIWLANADGSGQTQLTSFRGGDVNHARWSPDGTRLAFGGVVAGNRDIYLISAINPGAPQRLTAEPADDGRPRWSADGKWIYFRSDRSGRNEIWRMPVSGGAPVQFTKTGGEDSWESPDGTVYYYNTAHLWAMPVTGGAAQRVSQAGYTWGLGKEGVYFGRRRNIFLFDFATRKETQIATVEAPLVNHVALSQSPDGRTLIWSQRDRAEADIMAIENFR